MSSIKNKSPKPSKPVNYTLDTQKITFEFLKSHLWSAADILRGSLDSSEYRQPVMTLLFLKRLNDTFEENAENLIKKGINKKEAYNKRRHNFYIPENARWTVLSSTAENIGEKIDDVCRIIENRIVLVDGNQLTEYMIDKNIGVTLEKPYSVKKLDLDYFEELA